MKNPRNTFLKILVAGFTGYLLLTSIFKYWEAGWTITPALWSRELFYVPRGWSRGQASITRGTDDCPPVSSVPTAYVITPTYARHTQEVDMVRLCHTVMHGQHVRWIVIEDSNNETELIRSLLQDCQGVNITHLTAKSVPPGKRPGTNTTLPRHRGVNQRNEGLAWIRKCVLPASRAGGVYFGDDDNTYDIRIFDVVRNTTIVSMWKVGFAGGLLEEGPICVNGTVTGWRVGWAPKRQFPVDMAAFAVSLHLLAKFPSATFSPQAASGWLEPTFLMSLNISKTDILPAPDPNCSKILAWHTRTSSPNVNGELELMKKKKKTGR